MQGIKITEKIQRIISAWNHSPMGYSLPAAIGAALANPKATIICITGDGGLQINVQELATIERFNLPIKIFVMNNHGHGIIQGTQDQWLGGRHIASDYSGGLPDPDYTKVTTAYGIPTTVLKDHAELKKIISDVLSSTGPHACIVDMNEGSQIYPKLLAGKAIHEASPLLSDSELRKYMKYVPNSSILRK
jgi:acetolactate synthase-1/2/3 large subunit